MGREISPLSIYVMTMPSGIYIRTEEHKKILDVARKRRTNESKRKMVNTRRATDGYTSGMKGKHHSDESKEKTSNSMKGKNTWSKGKHLSDEHKKKLGLAAVGKKHSKEWCKKISQSLLGKPSPLKGRLLSDEHKRKLKGLKKGISLSAKTKERIRLARLNQIIPLRDTKIERMLQEELSSRDYAYYCHYPILGQPDIAFPDQKIAIFCDGDYFHADPKKYKENDTMFRGKLAKEIWEKDRKITVFLQSQGWLVVRYWEHEIENNLEDVANEIEDILVEVV